MRESGREERDFPDGPSAALAGKCVLVSLDPEQECPSDPTRPDPSGASEGRPAKPASAGRAKTPLAVMSVDDFSMLHVMQSLEKKTTGSTTA